MYFFGLYLNIISMMAIARAHILLNCLFLALPCCLLLLISRILNVITRPLYTREVERSKIEYSHWQGSFMHVCSLKSILHLSFQLEACTFDVTYNG
jgi:hypothetical protein